MVGNNKQWKERVEKYQNSTEMKQNHGKLKNGNEWKERNGNEGISIEMKGNDETWTEWSEMIVKEWIWKETMGNDG